MSGHHDEAHALPGALAAADAARVTARVARLSVATAIVLMSIKAWAWIASDSVAMLSSLADSGLDGIASLFTLLAVTYAAQPPDAEHRHGHGKAEAFAAMMQALLVGVSATLVALEAIDRFRNPQPIAQSGLALGVMIVSILLTLALLWAQTRAIRQTGSVATHGDRAHYAADLAANLAVIGGIGAATLLGLRWADPAVGLGVAAWLAWSALDVARGGFDQLLDRELPDEARARIRELALSTGGLLDIHGLRTRASGPYVHVQFHAELPPHLSLVEAHRMMVAAEKAIHSQFPAADVLIHPDPRGEAEPHGSRLFAEADHEGAA
ncbi:MAG: cation diffusion facilitator family transporter [Alphaproteobacteria bacterium]|jgi:cation diffusion facilitator family transporter|nr:cation diffusion facilitator family transporter [Alphaproteobacteria bacterium]